MPQLEITAEQGDITKYTTDAIVNAANTSLMGGGGVDGAIHRAAGPALLDACRDIVARQGKCKTGHAVITPAGKLPCRYVIHTVGPVWNTGSDKEKGLLRQAYQHSLALAEEHGLASVAFPNISTGVYRFPKPVAAEIAVQAVRDFADRAKHLQRVVFVCFEADNLALYQQLLGGAI